MFVRVQFPRTGLSWFPAAENASPSGTRSGANPLRALSPFSPPLWRESEAGQRRALGLASALPCLRGGSRPLPMAFGFGPLMSYTITEPGCKRGFHNRWLPHAWLRSKTTCLLLSADLSWELLPLRRKEMLPTRRAAPEEPTAALRAPRSFCFAFGPPLLTGFLV